MSDTLTLSLMGSPRIALNGRPCSFSSAKAIALLAYLAVSGMRHDRAALAVLLWPESDNKRARGALRYTLSTIKKEIGAEFLLVDRRHIGLSDKADWGVDVRDMRRLLAPALGLENGTGLTAVQSQSAAAGVALCQGDFLQGFTLRDADQFNEWAAIQGDALRRDLTVGLRQLAFYHHDQAQWDTAVTYGHRWLQCDPLHEPAHCQLMQSYAAAAQWTAVHHQHQALVDLLDEELGVPPQPETEALYQQLCQQRVTAAPVTPITQQTPAQRSRFVLIQKMGRFWVEDRLEPLQADGRFIHLKLQFTNEAINHPWADVLDIHDTPEAADMRAAFRASDRALLILGAPGAGKTIGLIGLARALLQTAVHDETAPVPVILNLSSWAGTQDSIAHWAVKELVVQYQIPRRTGRTWLAHDQILLLLDGLDEMPLADQMACIRAINTFRQTRGLPDVAVCCRQEAYETAVALGGAQLQLHGAVRVRPLTTAQIQQHAPPALVAAIFQDEALLDMTQSPLNLDMMQTALDGGADPSPETAPLTRSRLFDQYVQRMFRRQAAKGNGAYDPADLSDQLSWLAQQMGRHNQAIFLLEQLQPSWLANGRTRWLYLLLTRTALSVLLGTLVIWSFVQLIRINPPYIEVNFLGQLAARFGVTAAPWDTLFALFCLNLLVGLIAALLDGLFFTWRQRRGVGARRNRRLGWLHMLVVGTAVWAIIAIPLAMTDALMLAVFLGGLTAVGFVLAFRYAGGRQSWRTEVQVRGSLHWSWRNAAIWGLVGVALSLLWSGFIWLQDPTAVAWQLNVFTNGLMLFLFGGVTGKQAARQNRPNEGMRIAAKNGLKAAVLVAVPLGVITAVAISIPTGLYTGLMLALFAGSLYGFNDVIKHLSVRLLLWPTRRAPLHYTRLLNCAADCVLLQRVGGGYTFRHRLLQDYFAELG